MECSLGTCIITKNAKDSIARTINSVMPYSSQIVVIDTGSTDSTPVICTRFGAEVHFFKWVNDFSKARNYGLELMRTDWILVIDSDEKFVPNELNLSSIEANVGGINLEIINYLDEYNAELTSSHRYTRLFRNNKAFRFSGIIHEQIRESIEGSGFEIIQGNSKIIHYGYSHQNTEKQNRNKEMLQKEILNNHTDYNTYHLANTEFGLKNFDLAYQLFTSIHNSQELSLEQIENVWLRLAQISLIKENIYEIEKWTSFKSENIHIDGLRQFLIATSLMVQQKYKEAQVILNSNSVLNSSMVDKNILNNAINLIGELI